MWSKNYWILWKITENILHSIRNFFCDNEIRLLKRNKIKIDKKHSEMNFYFEDDNFSNLLNNAIFHCDYFDKENFIEYNPSKNCKNNWKSKSIISFIEEDRKFTIIWLKNTQHHIILTTAHSLDKKKIKKILKSNKDNIWFIKWDLKNLEKLIEEYL